MAPERKPIATRILAALLLAVLYFLASRFRGYESHILMFSPLWPENGIALAALLIFGWGLWPAIVIGGIIAELTMRTPVSASVLLTLGDLLQILVSVYLLDRLDFRRDFRRVQDVLVFIVIACWIAPALNAILTASVTPALSQLTWPTFIENLGQTWITEGTGVFVLTPALLILFRPKELPRTLASWAEGALFALSMLAMCPVVFLVPEARAYFLFPILTWGALRFRQLGAVVGILITAVFAIYFSAHGSTQFTFGDVVKVPAIQTFLDVVAASMLFLAAVTTERQEAERSRLALASREAALREEERSREYLASLAEASDVLGSSLDYDVTIQNVAKLLVPRLADFCLIPLLGVDGAIRNVPFSHSDPSFRPVLPKLSGFRPDPSKKHPVGEALAGKSSLVQNCTPEFLRSITNNEEHYQTLSQLSPRSYMAVPLIADGRTLGALVLGTTRASGRTLSSTELALAENLARRCAMAIVNAQLYSTAQTAISARNEFISVAAHELRTPLTSLRALAQVMVRQFDRGTPLDAPQQRRIFEILDQQSAKLSELITRLLDYTRIDAGKLTIEKSEVDLRPFVTEIVQQAERRAEGHPIRLEFEVDIQALIDPIRIEQVLVNLLDNAIKYSPEGTPIEVTVARDGLEWVLLAVRDHGSGIPPQERSRVFERFYRIEGTAMSGSGLGLYVSSQIVALHGGKIQIEAPASGGSRFVVKLPIGIPHHAARRPVGASS